MKPAITARRRAEEFHRLVEHGSTSGLPVSRDADLLVTVGALRRAAEPHTARPEFVSDLRARLMAAAVETLPATAVPAAPAPARVSDRRRERRLAVAVGGFALVSAASSMAVAAQSALPGDALYPLKRAIENIETGLRSDDVRGSLLLQNAGDRLAEVGALTREGGDSADIARTLDDFTAQFNEASSLLLDEFAADGQSATIRDLRDFAAESVTELDRLQSIVPVEARPALITAATTVSEVDALAAAACPACSSLPILTTPAFTSLESAADALDGASTPPAPAPTPSVGPTAPHLAGAPVAPPPADVVPPLEPGDPETPSVQLPSTPEPGTDTPSTIRDGVKGLVDSVTDPVEEIIDDVSESIDELRDRGSRNLGDSGLID